jgi:hypothetical protein
LVEWAWSGIFGGIAAEHRDVTLNLFQGLIILPFNN